MGFVYKLREAIEREVFTIGEAKALFCPQINPRALRSRISRAKGLLRLGRGLYAFPESLRRGPLSSFEIANKLYSPSYVSFESALSCHGLIPEAVHTTTSVCFQRKNKTFSNTLGCFSFDHLSCRPFFMGVTKHGEGGELIASPLKALFDLIAIRRKKYASLEDLEGDLRIDRESLGEEVVKLRAVELVGLAESYKKNNVDHFSKILIGEFK